MTANHGKVVTYSKNNHVIFVRSHDKLKII